MNVEMDRWVDGRNDGWMDNKWKEEIGAGWQGVEGWIKSEGRRQM